jgi:hypothetical protein
MGMACGAFQPNERGQKGKEGKAQVLGWAVAFEELVASPDATAGPVYRRTKTRMHPPTFGGMYGYIRKNR